MTAYLAPAAMLQHAASSCEKFGQCLESAGGKAFQFGKTLHNRHNRHLFRRSEPGKSTETHERSVLVPARVIWEGPPTFAALRTTASQSVWTQFKQVLFTSLRLVGRDSRINFAVVCSHVVPF